MKTAVSLPDDVFEQAELLVKQYRVSRSELYSRALREFVARHAPDRVTDTLNAVCDAVSGERDPFVSKASRRILDRIEW